MTSPVLDELLHIERAGWDSLCESSGADFYGELMLPDAVMVLANGMVMDRNTVVSALAQSPPWRAYEISGVRLIALDHDNAALVYTGTAYRDGDEPAFVGAMSSVYHRVDGVWKLTLYRQTRKPDQ
ncbi:nuclear transport factor 2 family protein [Mycolicibacterium septicum]|uniref:nuclear transport factor 2 family protein n=1 Tax=Mycolicibacterium septicum TaxID=98668 RepID=UPI00236156A2|nr:nuclear transport factor 2 family protein [Mycolicibacterium septicum]